MTPRAEFEAKCSEIWDGHGWKMKLAAECQVSPNTVTRWLKEDCVPNIVRKAIDLIYREKFETVSRETKGKKRG